MCPPPPELEMVQVPCPVCGAREGAPWARGKDFEYGTSELEFTFRRCARCANLYLDPRPAASELDRIYPESYAPYRFDRPSLTLRVRRRLEGRRIARLRPLLPPGARILDGGCGGPGFLENLRRHGAPGWRLHGNDISPAVVADLERRGFTALPGRFEEIDRPPGSFDAIFLKQVIEHLAAPRAVLERAARLLAPGGLLVVETPSTDAWDARLFRRRWWGGYHFPRHWTLFSPATLAAAVEEVGLRIQDMGWMLSPSFWVQSVHHRGLEKGWPRWLLRRATHLDPVAVGLAVLVDAFQLLWRGRTSNMRLVARRPEAGEGR